jgi:ribosomal protein S18 acetylase RimI-like enzyme
MAHPTLRPARLEDAEAVLDLSEIAGHGFLPHYFAQMLPKGQDLRAFMLSRVQDPHSKMSYTKCRIAEVDGQVAGMINLDPIPADPGPISPDIPAMFRPLAQLEARATETVVIEFLATLPAFRGHGVGTALLRQADRERGPRGVSLVVSDNNSSARSLYASYGFQEVERRAIIKDGWHSAGTEWILMIKP